MILISCRSSFESNYRFADENEIRRYAALSRLDRFETLTERELQETVSGTHVLVLVHGYRNPVRSIARAYGLIERTLRSRGLLEPPHYGHVLGFMWPGFKTRIGFFAAVSAANRSAASLRELLRVLKPHAKTTDLQTHSLGARVGLQALAFENEGLWVDNLLLTAPAVDNESLEPAQEFHDSLDSVRRCLVYHSSRDKVLRVGYRVGALDRALGCTGPGESGHGGVIVPGGARRRLLEVDQVAWRISRVGELLHPLETGTGGAPAPAVRRTARPGRMMPRPRHAHTPDARLCRPSG